MFFQEFAVVADRLEATFREGGGGYSHILAIRVQVFGGFRLILFLYIRCFLQNEPENVLKVFLKYSTACTLSSDEINVQTQHFN